MEFSQIIAGTGLVLDASGVVVIAVGSALAAIRAAADAAHKRPDLYHRFRRRLGRSILLGLELLVAADIIRTVAVAPTLRSVIVLGIIVIIPTFLSFSLELEVTGSWPWQKRTLATRVTDQPEARS
ncbi:DUF1622 domain-containing protein [Herbiconiux sp. CPCC 205716]|uniref:DUF1622 domain-containing protein n=1 Tax=Herbiconiux gentiana TaxID=2970912 RepID=A0ABT2GAM3_9MICO|nr:DUF1622 domain-containing protein [Herbiconiux gentiana]MCS5713198.1 DUF1622 domain-containing protein [Herbiconiux gentiana]